MVNQSYNPNYNSNYNPNYQYCYPGSQIPYQQPVQSVPNQILAWVQNEKEAIDYPLSTGQSIFLMNQNDNYLYAKTVDQLGKTTFIKKRLVDETENADPKIDLTEYIKKEDIQDIILDIVQKEVEKRVSQISFKPTRKKTVVVDDEED